MLICSGFFFFCSSRSINYQRGSMWVCSGKKHIPRSYCERQAQVREYRSRVRPETKSWANADKLDNEETQSFTNPLLWFVSALIWLGKKISPSLPFTNHCTRCDPLTTSPQPSWSHCLGRWGYPIDLHWRGRKGTWRQKGRGLRMHGACQSWRGSQDVEWNNKRQKQKDAELHILGFFWRLYSGHAAVAPT